MTQATPVPGDILNGRYRLEEIIGQGGMAVVWRAEDGELGRAVAVKILRDQYALDPEFLARFKSEARSAAALNHPGVVGVYDVGRQDGRHFLVMEHILGQDLKQIIRAEAPLDPARVTSIGVDLSRAVAEAHSIGMVHRDIKPQNVLITEGDRLKVTDFGIARAVSEAGLTQPGIVMGTVHYIAPEQAAGKPASPASDAYSIGVVLYEMLTGRVPFQADSGVGVAMKVMNETALPISSFNPSAPQALIRIVEKAMSKDLDTRYANASELADALDGYRDWAEQRTQTDFEPPPSDGSEPPPPEIPPARPSARSALKESTREGAALTAEPLLTPTGLLLGFVALVSLIGLIPLWTALAVRSEPTGSPGGIRPFGAATKAPQPVASPTVAIVSVPNVEGMSEADARSALESAGFDVTVDYLPNAAVVEGHVISQLTPAGRLEELPKTVRIEVSSRGRSSVPYIDGMDWEQAVVAIENAGLTPQYREFWQGSNSETQGLVIDIAPVPGQEVAFGSEVWVTMDSGAWHSIQASFDDKVYLRGASIDRDIYAAGEAVVISPIWESTGLIERDYLAKVTLRSAGGVQLSEAIVSPIAGDGRQTSAWGELEESIVGQPLVLPLPPDAFGDYSLFISLAPVDSPDAPISVLRVTNPDLRIIGSEVRFFGITVGEAVDAAPDGDSNGEAADG